MAPTLLLVGGLDSQVLNFNHIAYEELQCEKHLEVIEQASHLFEEADKLEKVAELAAQWFKNHIPPHCISTHL